MPTWGELFDRAADPVAVEEIQATLAERRERRAREQHTEHGGSPRGETRVGTRSTPREERDAPDATERRAGGERGGRPDPTRIVADADVLVADLLAGGDARASLDAVRAHSWTTLVATEPLLDDAAVVIEELAGPSLATAWRGKVAELVTVVDQPPSDHPALAAALHGHAAHVLTFDGALTGAAGNARVRSRVETSPKTPAAFARLFDPAKLYAATRSGGEPDAYPGPDRDPRE